MTHHAPLDQLSESKFKQGSLAYLPKQASCLIDLGMNVGVPRLIIDLLALLLMFVHHY